MGLSARHPNYGGHELGRIHAENPEQRRDDRLTLDRPSSTASSTRSPIVLGIDAHKRSHTIVAVDDRARKLAERTINATTDDHLALIAWAQALDDPAIVDAAEELAALALEAGAHDLVIWAGDHGLRVDPAREELYQQWMHTLGHTADPDRVTTVWGRLCAVLPDRIGPLQEPTPGSRAVYRMLLWLPKAHEGVQNRS
jgi:hypothetical protein